MDKRAHRKAVKKADRQGQRSREELLQEDKLDDHETEEDKEGGALEDDRGIAERPEGQGIQMAGQRAHVELAIVTDRRRPALGDVLSHKRGDGIIAGHQSGGSGQEGKTQDDGKQKDNEESGCFSGKLLRKSKLKAAEARGEAERGQTQPGNEGEQIMNAKIPQRGEVVLEPEDDEGDEAKVLEKPDTADCFASQCFVHYS